MTEKETTQSNNSKAYSSSYGGIIEPQDFYTLSPNKKRIHNQTEAMELPKELAEKKKEKEMEKKYKHMTFEELREMKIVSNTDGRPTVGLTNEKWQKEFNVRKLFITPYDKSIKSLGGKYSKESGIWHENSGTYYGATNWQHICSHINDILKNIRAGQVDYCYYIYNIMELAKFHYDDLRTKYHPCDDCGYWEVWLERKGRYC